MLNDDWTWLTHHFMVIMTDSVENLIIILKMWRGIYCDAQLIAAQFKNSDIIFILNIDSTYTNLSIVQMKAYIYTYLWWLDHWNKLIHYDLIDNTEDNIMTYRPVSGRHY